MYDGYDDTDNEIVEEIADAFVMEAWADMARRHYQRTGRIDPMTGCVLASFALMGGIFLCSLIGSWLFE